MKVRELLSLIDTKIINGVSQVKLIEIITEPLPQPKRVKLGEATVFLMPIEPEKIKEGKELFRYIHTIRIIVVTRYATTQEESLTDSTYGLLKTMEDIEELLENDMLFDSGIPQLYKCRIYPEDYSYAEFSIADNIYCRAGSLLYEAEPKSHVKAVT
ncbi:hypothetical protein KAX02_05375 [candidate division WOR-3 bacterium]|nr:hypothetical protein [candidate division WOR-3 bacterium]